MIHKIALFSAFLAIFLTETLHSQMISNFDIAGGPSAGWFFNNTDDLNRELKNAGFPELSKNGFFTMGGSGFIDVPFGDKHLLRLGGLGVGFASKQKNQLSDSLTKAVNYNFGMGGISIEYVIPAGTRIDIVGGLLLTTGTLKIDLYQYGNDYGNYNSIFGELYSNGSTKSITRNFVQRFYGVQPQAGIGIFAAKYLYFKLTAGYYISAGTKWRVDNDIEVKNFPDGIKSGGFNLSLGMNLGLFLRD